MTKPSRSRKVDAEPLPPDPEGEFPINVDDYLFHLLAAVGRMRDGSLDGELRAVGLSVIQYRALAFVVRLQPVPMSALAEVTSIDRTTLTRVIDALVAAGHVDRSTPPTDRRRVDLTPTPGGEATFRRAAAIVAAHNRGVLDGIPDETRRAAVRAAQMLVANLARNGRVAEQLLTLRQVANGDED